MTEPVTAVRAVAKVGVPSSRPDGPAVLTPVRRVDRLGPVHVLQVLFVEGVLLGVFALTDRGPAATALAVVVALGLAAAALVRSHGRWWLEQRVMARLYRRRAAAARRMRDNRLAELQLLAPGLTVAEVGGAAPASDDPEEFPAPVTPVVAVARDAAGWFAAAELHPGDKMAGHPAEPVPLPLLVKALGTTNQAGLLLQVVTQTGPAHEGIPADTLAARSYRDLHGTIAAPATPTDRACWLVVRLDARLLADAGAEDDAAARVPAVVAALLRLVVRSLHRSGLSAAPLDHAGLLAALHESCGLALGGMGGATDPPREEWRGWHAGGLAHIGYWVRDWPRPAAVPALLQALSSVPDARTTVAVVVAVPPLADAAEVADPPLTDAEMRCLVRVGADPARAEAVHDAVLRRAREHGAGLHRLDGQHGPAAYATAPTGGGAW